MLPGGGGLHVLQKIKKVPGLAGIPVLILTGTHDAEIKQKIVEEHVDGYFQKPYDYTALSKSIKELLSAG